MIIYLITCLITGMQYIGKTTGNLQKRWKRHCYENKCRYLYNAIKKYGKENFRVKPIFMCDSEILLNQKEQYYIKLYNTLAPNGYNLTEGGEGGKLSEETKKKISKSLLGNQYAVGYKHTKETKAKMSLQRQGSKNGMFGLHRFGKDSPHYGKKHSVEAKQKMSISQTGKKRSPKVLKAMSKRMQGSKNPFFGKRHTLESRAKISAARKKWVADGKKENN